MAKVHKADNTGSKDDGQQDHGIDTKSGKSLANVDAKAEKQAVSSKGAKKGSSKSGKATKSLKDTKSLKTKATRLFAKATSLSM